MCGIAGIFAYRNGSERVSLEELRAIRDHMIRRGPDGRLMAVPYSTEYQGELAIAAMHLREAAKPIYEADRHARKR